MWRVRLGRKFTLSRVIERNFLSVEEAHRFIKGCPATGREGVDALRSVYGLSGIELSPRELAEAREAVDALRKAKVGTISEAVHFYLKHNAPATKQPTTQAIDAFIKCKEQAGCSKLHTKPLRKRIEKLAEFAKARLVCDLERAGIERWLTAMQVAPKTKANALRDVRIFANYCRIRGWMPHDPTKGIERPKAIASEAGILLPMQAKRLLANADRRIKAGLAIKLFAGLRSSEVRRLDWKDVTQSHVVVRAENAKTRSRRAVEITDNLSAWLKDCRGTEGPVVNLSSRRWHELMTQAATDADAERSEENPASYRLIGKLPQNFARHSFGTYHFALHQDEAKTAAAMGNTPAMVHRHYRALATADEAREFFGILPPEAE